MAFALNLFAVLAVVSVTEVLGFASYRSRIPNGFAVQHPCDASKVWSGVGHNSDQGGDARNPFGLDFQATGHAWTDSLCRADSDKDGLTNGQELGDPDCKWQPGQSAQRSTNITHPGFDSSRVDCTRFFKRCKAFDAPGVKYFDLRAANGSEDTIVPAKETTYYNMNFELPADRQYHAVGFAPILDNVNVIHHFLVYSCDRPRPTGKGFEAFSNHEDCQRLVYGWSFGMGDECFPMDTGVPFGGKHPRYVQLQLHWTNRNKVAGYRDMSGVRMYYTSKPRKYDLGFISVGQLNLNIPSQQPAVEASFGCSSGCTKTLLDQGPVKLITGAPHMHFLGKSMLVDLIKPTGHRQRILNDKVYNYNAPATYDYPSPNYIDLEAGDKLVGSCTFNSMDRNDSTYWGYGSYDEMCFGFFRYYPSRGALNCYQYGENDLCYDTTTVDGPRCSLFHYFENITVTVNNAMHACSDVMHAAAAEQAKQAQDQPTGSGGTATTRNARPVCTSQCLAQVSRILKAHRDPCQKTRHRKEWKLLDSLVSQRTSTLDDVVSHCQTVGMVEEEVQQLNSGSSTLLMSCPLFIIMASLRLLIV
ncbi:DBH-like monooxygenase protein 2 [Sycon ciliatum]|uniref:DBH-like monooxygenase protein 2 n=1 Tax=Sycon ciliatum TaxID=27933 RepID=UPI0031F625EF